MEKKCVMAGLGHFYSDFPTGLAALPFIYNNIQGLAKQLKTTGWVTDTPLLDDQAYIDNIKNKLLEIINGSKNDNDWITFYFTGHATKQISHTGAPSIPYCVTYVENLTRGRFPDISHFFSGKDYSSIVEAFAAKVPNGHLITILDCCYASGILDGFVNPADYHTIISATAANFTALYSDNSVFYKEFIKVIHKPFNQMQRLINLSLASQHIPEQCIIKPANKFKDQTF